MLPLGALHVSRPDCTDAIGNTLWINLQLQDPWVKMLELAHVGTKSKRETATKSPSAVSYIFSALLTWKLGGHCLIIDHGGCATAGQDWWPINGGPSLWGWGSTREHVGKNLGIILLMEQVLHQLRLLVYPCLSHYFQYVLFIHPRW